MKIVTEEYLKVQIITYLPFGMSSHGKRHFEHLSF